MKFYGGGKDSVITKYFLFLAGVFGVLPDTDSGIRIFWEFRASEGQGAIIGVNGKDIGSDGLGT